LSPVYDVEPARFSEEEELVNTEDNSGIMNLEQAMELLGNSPELFYEISTQFIKDVPRYIQHLKDGLAENDVAKIRDSVHSIKGMVVIFSAQRTLQAIASVEESVGRQDCATNIKALENEITNLVKSIQSVQVNQIT
jgi:HPt (histidine-containing phosphotransfer) domain-containing protein